MCVYVSVKKIFWEGLQRKALCQQRRNASYQNMLFYYNMEQAGAELGQAQVKL